MPTFATPALLVLAVLAPLAVWALHGLAEQARRRTWRAMAPSPLRARLVGARPWHRARRAAVVTVAAALVAVAMARPQRPGGEETVTREGLDLVVALDVSQSMLAEDVAPSRLERARSELRRLADALPGDRLGLVLFAGDAFVQCPLTTDHAAFRLFLDAAAPEMLPTQGTDFEAALAAAADAFGPPPTSTPPGTNPAARVVLVVSDGENHDGRIARARSMAREAGAVIFAAGVGEASGAPVPDIENGRRVGNKVDPETGEEVRSRLDADALRELSEGGAYVHVGRLTSDMETLPDRLAGMERGALGTTTMGRMGEAFAWPLALALLLLIVEAMLPDARPAARPTASLAASANPTQPVDPRTASQPPAAAALSPVGGAAPPAAAFVPLVGTSAAQPRSPS